MPDARWPNTEVRLYQDRYGGWRARVDLRIGDEERMFYVPALTQSGVGTRLQLMLCVEVELDAIGVACGHARANDAGTVELAKICIERDQAREQVEVLRAERDALERLINTARKRLEELMREHA